MEKTQGLIAAPYTPFNNAGELNVKLIPAYAAFLKKSGVKGVFVNGTTGEGASLTVNERMECAEAWQAQKDENFRVIIHVGHNSLSVSRELARNSRKINADAIGLIAPSYYKTESLSSLVQVNSHVAGAAPDLPYYYYHMPAMSGAFFPMAQFLEMAEKIIPNLAGIKYTHEDLMEMKLCLEYGGRKFDILHGRDEILLCGLALGATGAIGSTYNYMAPLYVRLMEAFSRSNLAEAGALQYESIKFIQVLIRYGGGVRAGKSFMRAAGLDLGQPRLPVTRLSADEEKHLQEELQGLGFPGNFVQG